MRQSVGRTIQLRFAIILFFTLLLTFVIGYQTTISEIEDHNLASLYQLTRSHADQESQVFLLAQQNVASLHDALQYEIAVQDREMVQQEFEKLFKRSEDGLLRVDESLNDFQRLPTLYLQHDVEINESIRQRAVASYRLLKARGPAIVPPFYSVYMDFVEKGLMVYSPHVDWGGNATRETDNYNYPTMTGSMPGNNPERKIFWTKVYLDKEADVWMVSVIKPFDYEGSWVGTLGHDVAIDALMETTLNRRLDGTYNIILSREGQLIVHPDFTEQIDAAGGDLSLESLNDPRLNSIFSLIMQNGEGVWESSTKDFFVATSKITGPDWYLVTVYPSALLASQVRDALWLPLTVAILTLLVAMVLVRRQVRQLIIRPLSEVESAISEMSKGVQESRIPVSSEDEIGRLARSFEQMSNRLYERERLIEDARRDWERTFDAVQDLIVVLDRDYRIVQANSAFANATGYSKEELHNLVRTELADETNQKQIHDLFITAMETRQTHQLKVLVLERFSLEVTISPLIDSENNIIGAVEISRNVTEKEQLESELRQAHKMDAVGKLAGGVAHDFNNLLQIIMGYTEPLHAGMDESDPARAALDQVIEAASRAADLTRQLLIFSRQDNFQNPQPVDLCLVIREVSEIFRRLLGENLNYRVNIDVENAITFGVRNQIDQVLINLGINARDAMPNSGTLTLSLDRQYLDPENSGYREGVEPGTYFRISVADTGSGMDDVTRERIFEPFFTTKDVGKGTGLGLATAYEIIRRHLGYIEVESRLGEGTTFHIYLPENLENPETDVEGVQLSTSGGHETILVAEDDDQIRTLCCQTLQDAGYTVFTAANGLEAVSLYRQHAASIDLLILDVVMPEMGGLEAFRILAPRNATPDCVFTTGYSPEKIVEEFSSSASIEVLSKPYSSGSLLRTVRKILDNRKVRADRTNPA